MTVSLVTCVTNAAGMGPGHSCIDISGTVHTFENQSGGWFNGSSSGWLSMSRKSYLDKNKHRPVILQTLITAVDSGKAHNYIAKSKKDDEDYGSSGVCSSQAAATIEAAWGKDFNTVGVDKPYEIYDLAKTKKLVVSEVMHWPGKANCNLLVRTRIEALLKVIKSGWTWAAM